MIEATPTEYEAAGFKMIEPDVLKRQDGTTFYLDSTNPRVLTHLVTSNNEGYNECVLSDIGQRHDIDSLPDLLKALADPTSPFNQSQNQIDHTKITIPIEITTESEQLYDLAEKPQCQS
jgi:hypothetical protein